MSQIFRFKLSQERALEEKRNEKGDLQTLTNYYDQTLIQR